MGAAAELARMIRVRNLVVADDVRAVDRDVVTANKPRDELCGRAILIVCEAAGS